MGTTATTDAAGRASRTFAALRVPAYRTYFVGQGISASGTWMQGVAQGYFVLKLTGSGVALGTVVALQTLPILVFGAYAGVVADRVDKRRLLVATQAVAGLLALTLGLLVQAGVARFWMVCVLATGLGFVMCVDTPARQTLVPEMVGPDLLTNAVSLNSSMMNASRVVGPALSGVVIANVGIAACFLVNSVSYLAAIGSLLLIHQADLRPAPRKPRAKGQLREGFRYVWATPALRTPLLMMAVIGTLAYEYPVTLPLLAENAFHGGATALAKMTSVMGFGAVVGSLISASTRGPSTNRLVGTAVGFGGLMLVASQLPSLPIALLVLPCMSAVSITFLALANTTLQLTAAPEMRGRVMALYTVAFIGSTPIGGPLVGAVGQHVGPRAPFVLGGSATVVAALLGWRSLRRADAADHLVLVDEDGPEILTELVEPDAEIEGASFVHPETIGHGRLVRQSTLDANPSPPTPGAADR